MISPAGPSIGLVQELLATDTLANGVATDENRMSDLCENCENCEKLQKSQNSQQLEKTSPPNLLRFLRF